LNGIFAYIVLIALSLVTGLFSWIFIASLGIVIIIFTYLATRLIMGTFEFYLDDRGIKSVVLGIQLYAEYENISSISKKVFFNKVVVRNSFPMLFPPSNLIKQEDKIKLSELLSNYVNREHPLFIEYGLYVKRKD
jgi:hypothetical protein